MILIAVLISIAALLILFLLFYFVVFLRNPERDIPKGTGIVSPADGKVIRVEKFSASQGMVRIKKGSPI